ncbi:MAG: glutamate formiminotransferase / 5-formyltetrahydrofolate cyclo-ligase [Verrucomicrobiota bacterium]|jgi:glutamate formiminotransferase/formiminotetrahydrofolate cyclodeaminase
MQKVIECVPNFSEGRDLEVIRQITTAIESVDGISLLNVDPGASTNRTVVTFAGSPEAAVEAAFRGIQKAAALIDMRKHKGAHPRMGATDVCPFIPVSNVSWEEAITCANRLGKRVGEELKIPVYLYEKAAKDPSRSNLSIIRSGEYEGFFEKIKEAAWQPDFGPSVFNEKSGATVIGAREFLVAYNVNLNSRAVRRATAVAFDVRENGRAKTDDGTPRGKPVLDANGEPVRVPGMLKHVKAIGWYVEEYGIAQVSMNLTNIEETPLHAAFDACNESASKRGLRVTGSEVVGMLPKKCLVEAGKYFLRKQQWSEGASEEELIDIAIRSMGLNELKPFDPKERIIEFKMESAAKKSLVKMNLREFCSETLSDSPAPGGGSVAALMGALGVSLGGMVANLSAGKRGWEDKLSYFSDWAVKAQQLKDELLFLVDEDTAAFNKVMDAFGLPKESAEEKAARSAAIQLANKYAAEIPLRVMETASKSYQLLAEMAEKGNPASISDVGVGLLALRACIDGAAMNVRINLAGLKDEKLRSGLQEKVRGISAESEAEFRKISQIVESKIG